jgi:CHAD domain-containing protein
MLVAQEREIIAHDPGTRLGTDPEDLHQHRVAVRRLRALLRAAEPMLDSAWAEGLRRELQSVGRALGAVRDLDVLLEHLQAVGEELGIDDEEPFQRVTGVFEARRSHARAVMLDELRKPAYALLLDRLERELPEPRVSGESTPLAEIAGEEHRVLAKTMHKLGDDPDDATLHAARIKVKHARYAAELARATVGRPASRYISSAKRLQDILGDHQDATVARTELKGVAKLLDDPDVTAVVKRLRQYEKMRKRESREAYPAAWNELQERGEIAWG